MDRREMFGVSVAAILPVPAIAETVPVARPVTVIPVTVITVGVIKADEPTRNGYINSSEMLARCLPNFKEVPVVLGEPWRLSVASPVVGTVQLWAIRDGWLTADIEICADLVGKIEAGALVCRPCVMMTDSGGKKPRQVTEVTEIVRLYLEVPDAQSWVEGVPACPKCGGGTRPVQWLQDRPRYKCGACGDYHMNQA